MLRGFIQEMAQCAFCIVNISIHPLSSEMSYVTYWDNTAPFSLFYPPLCAWSCCTVWNCSTCNAFIHSFLREDKPTGAVKVWKLIIQVHSALPPSYTIFPLQTKHTHTQIEEDRCELRHSHTEKLQHWGNVFTYSSWIRMACHAHVSLFGITLNSGRSTFSLISRQDDSLEIALHSASISGSLSA